jgi:hypothetical protein
MLKRQIKVIKCKDYVYLAELENRDKLVKYKLDEKLRKLIKYLEEDS